MSTCVKWEVCFQDHIFQQCQKWNSQAKVCGCYLINLSSSPTSTNEIYNKICVALASFDETIATTGLKTGSPWFSYGHQKCMFVDFLTGYLSPPNCVHY